MIAYYDTSVMVSLYMRDSSYNAALALSQASKPALWTPWQRMELNNAVRLYAFRKIITNTDIATIERIIKTATEKGDLSPCDIPVDDWWQEAETLSKSHTSTLGVRTLDLLHVAAARVLNATHFYTFDTRQLTLAQAAGLRTN